MDFSLDTLAKIAEIIGAIAVVLSLIYVGYQIKQNTKAVRSSVHQSLINHVTATEGLVLTNKRLADILIKSEANESALSASERLQLEKYITLEFVNWENAFLNWQSGLLDENVWKVWDRSNHPTPEMHSHHRFWSQHRDWFDDSFANYVDDLYQDQGFTTSDQQV